MRVYFSGIGGVAIGPLSEIAHDAGYDVCGSDQAPSLMTEQLAERNILVSFDQSGDFLQQEYDKKPFDWYVYTAALPENHPELQLAKKLGIKISKRDELLAHIISDKNLELIAVAGTHGKTTTTGMFVWVMQQLGMPVSYSVGSTLSFGPSGKFEPNSKYFVYECDEFDRNFLCFHPAVSIITTVNYDHPDTYSTPQDYIDAFRQFGEQSGHVIAWGRYQNIFDEQKTTFMDDIDPRISLVGEHNRANAALVLQAIKNMNIDLEEGSIISAINSFPGTNRRFEKVATNLYSDYGHHPVEIEATLQLASELSDHVVLVYQPHQNVRQHEIRNQYTTCADKVEEIYWLPTYLSRENPDLPILTPQELTQKMSNQNIKYANLDDELWQIITTARKNNKLVLCMGAGTIDSWVRKNLQNTSE